MAKTNEIDLLNGCTSGEERRRLLADLFEKHRKRLRIMVSLRIDRRIQGRIDPSDVLQEAFLEASKGIEKFLGKPEIPFYSWLRFLAGRKLQEMHRRHLGAEMRDPRREVSLYGASVPAATSEELTAQLLSQGTSPSKAAERAEVKAKLEEAVDSLDPLDREVIALRHFEQLTTAEVAQVLGIQQAAARKRYLRALDKLKKILAGMRWFREDAS